MNRINLVTTCTNGKHGDKNNVLSLSHYLSEESTSADLIDAWCNTLNAALSTSTLIQVENLYKGGHWATAKAIREEYSTDLWALSAGLGLLHCQDNVVPYKATFATGYPESIPLFADKYAGKTFHKVWWQEIADRSFFKSAHPTSLADLMKEKPRDYFVICGSPDYINAIESDLLSGLNHLEAPKKQLIIITSKKTIPSLGEYFLTSNSNIAGWFKCNMLMLNIMLAQHFIKTFTHNAHDDFSAVAQLLSAQFQSLPAKEATRGIKRNGEDVQAYILTLLQQQPLISATQALRTFRDAGNAFEEKRFRALFKAVAASKA